MSAEGRWPADIPVLRPDILVDVRSTLGEGPTWDEARQVVWWIDILGATVHRSGLDGSDRTFDVGAHIGCVVLAEDGRLVLGLADGLAWMDPDTGAVTRFADLEADDPGTRANDGKVDPRGRLWIGTMAYDARAGAGTLYRVAQGRVEPVLHDLAISNGLDWPADGRSMLFIDSATYRIGRYAWDAETGDVGAAEPYTAIPESAGMPDGMTLDAEGGAWVALWDGWGVVRFDPTGRPVARIDVPTARSSSCAFAGPDLDVLVITSASEGLTPEARRDQPHAGSLFAVRPGVRGRLPFHYLP